MATPMISPAAQIGAVALTVSDLDRSLDFYTNKMGFKLQERAEGTARLSAGGETLLALTERPGARKMPRTTGLYHFAVLVPTRFHLAQALRSLAEGEAAFQGAADHGVSEALYLADPDGSGIEIYVDRAAADWPRDAEGALQMGTAELDLDGLLAELQADPRSWNGLPEATRVGHVHLHVSNLARSEVFYTGVLGLKLMQRYGSAAAFLSAGGYHHHVGINTWAGAGAPPPPPDSVGLRWFSLRLPDSAALEQVAARVRAAGLPLEERPEGLFLTDPSGNGIILAAVNSAPQGAL